MARRLIAAAVSLGLCLLTSYLPAQELNRYTETDQGESTLALGYPVPMPVSSVEPVAGFRSYASLHARHQDFMLTEDIVDGFVVGQTHQGRDIWAYVVGDPDETTTEGLPEPAMMINGGIHAREWQAPEVVTGLMEHLVANADDDGLGTFLRDRANIVILPVNNIDGFIQTQRFPQRVWLGTDPGSPESSPRDGRMRRKNMRAVDNRIRTLGDHLLGIDLNRNAPVDWGRPGSSGDPASLVYRGAEPLSEPETQALAAARALGPESRLRFYTDVHSFTRRFFLPRTRNARRNDIARDLVDRMRETLAAQGTPYGLTESPAAGGFGATDEFFAQRLQIPSYTLEIEPTFNGGADYGGFGVTHDGFILPESEIERVRREHARSFALAFYHQSGPPRVAAVEIRGESTGRAVYRAHWSLAGERRELAVERNEPLMAGRRYELWLAFDKPMRWRDEGQLSQYPGQAVDLIPELRIVGGGARQTLPTDAIEWLNEPGGAPDGYRRYRDDALRASFVLSSELVDGGELSLSVRARDMAGLQLDADPSTPVDWQNGAWVGYEDGQGESGDTGGVDRTIQLSATTAIEPEQGLWWTPTRNGSGMDLQQSGDRLTLLWYTYTPDGAPVWYTAVAPFDGSDWETPIERVSYDVATGSTTGNMAGHIALRFDAADRAVFEWDLTASGGGTGSRAVEPLRFAAGTPTVDHTGTWAPSDADEAGWGASLDSQGDRLGAVLYYYDAAGNPRWALGNREAGTTIDVGMSSFTGPCPSCAANGSVGEGETVGTVSLDFAQPPERRAAIDTDIAFPGTEGGRWQRAGVELIPLTDPVAR